MTAAEISTIVASIGTPLLLVGGGVKWVINRVDKLDERLKEAEKKYARLDRDHARLMVQVDRWRIAFRMVAAGLRKHDPDAEALRMAEEMLAETPVGRSNTPEEETLLDRLEQDEGQAYDPD